MQQNKLSLALVITLALDATQDVALDAIDAIRTQFKLTDDIGSISPTALADMAGTPRMDAVASPVADALATVENVEVDSTGLPWDERIHASTKGKNADGSFKKRRGVDDLTFQRVANAIRVTAGAPATPAAVPAPPVAVAPVPAPPAPAVPPPPAPAAPSRYQQFVAWLAPHLISEANPAGRVDAAWVTQTLAAFQIADGSMQNLAHATDEKIGEIQAAIAGALGVAG
jgi:hypothetical protein